MSKTFSLVAIIRAFLGDADSGVAIVGDAIAAAAQIMAVGGTRAPVEEAVSLIVGLKGKTLRERALQTGLRSVLCDADKVFTIKGAKIELVGLRAGKHTPDEGATLSDSIGAAFVLAVGELMTAPKATYAKPAASDTAARAVKALSALSDPQFVAMMRSNSGADMLARIERIKAVHAAHDAIKHGDADAMRAKRGAAKAIERAASPTYAAAVAMSPMSSDAEALMMASRAVA